MPGLLTRRPKANGTGFLDFLKTLAARFRNKELAKPVILETAEARLVMAVIPGPRFVDLKTLEGLLGARVEGRSGWA